MIIITIIIGIIIGIITGIIIRTTNVGGPSLGIH